MTYSEFNKRTKGRATEEQFTLINNILLSCRTMTESDAVDLWFSTYGKDYQSRLASVLTLFKFTGKRATDEDCDRLEYSLSKCLMDPHNEFIDEYGVRWRAKYMDRDKNGSIYSLLYYNSENKLVPIGWLSYV